MKAARLHKFGQPLRFDEVPIPEVKGDEVLVRMAASYICSSDLRVIDGRNPAIRLPLTPGHNNAGYIAKVGPAIADLKIGTPVAVFGGWGCGHCRFCRMGEEQLCSLMKWVGFGADGGYAEYLHVPARRHVLTLDQLSPVEAAPLIDAGLTPYRAVKKMLPYLYPGSYAAIIGVGNLGIFAVQIIKAISPATRIIAVDVNVDRLRLASEMGSDCTIEGNADVAAEIKKLTDGEGAVAVLDTVGTNATLKVAAEAIGKKGVIVVIGIAGGTLAYSFLGLPPECIVTSSDWGSYSELEEVITLAQIGKIRSLIRRFSLNDINEVHRLMNLGQRLDHAVLTFDQT